MTSNVVRQARGWYFQRISAMVLALCVVVHIGVIIYAVRGGLSAIEILARTRGNWGFGIFYATFVLACAVHVPIGVANIAEEWWGWSNRGARILFFVAGLLILLLGLRAVAGVTFP
ncbi:succinate dehydrogenase [Glaciimonas sp. GNP009]